ncbi:MAG: hypothetical protein QXM96_01175 [Candidatus Woesearchaeota archaeon]
MIEIKRASTRLWIKDILKASFLKTEALTTILTDYGNIYKVLIMGIIVSKQENYLLIDDGSGNISLRFINNINNYSLGDCILVIGRVKEYNNNKYIVPDIIKKTDRKWFDFHRIELKKQEENKILSIETKENEMENEIGPYQKIINTIAALDKGDGVDINDIINSTNIKNCENLINNLIEEGDVFEISPGKVKLLN